MDSMTGLRGSREEQREKEKGEENPGLLILVPGWMIVTFAE